MTDLKVLPDGKREGAAILAALDNAPLTRSHWLFLAALFGALVFDYMKPYTLSFVIPGTRAMFGLSEGQAAYLPVAGLTGTALGAAFWGVVADRIGRRTTLLWTVAIFTLGSLCGLSTSYWQMLAACLVMGFGVGGETPIVFSLAAEYVPARSRSGNVSRGVVREPDLEHLEEDRPPSAAVRAPRIEDLGMSRRWSRCRVGDGCQQGVLGLARVQAAVLHDDGDVGLED